MKRKLKICGVNTIQSVKASIKADYIGFVFYGKSPRFVNAIKAKELSIYCSEKQKKVGLFVDSENSVIEYIAEYVGLNYIQLHGNENLEKIMYLKEKLKLPIIKSIAISSKEDCHKIKYYENFCDMILLDSKPSINTLPGGTGKSFDWKIIKDIIKTKYLKFIFIYLGFIFILILECVSFFIAIKLFGAEITLLLASYIYIITALTKTVLLINYFGVFELILLSVSSIIVPGIEDVLIFSISFTVINTLSLILAAITMPTIKFVKKKMNKI